MNPIAIIILLSLILDFLIQLFADILNLKAIKTNLPSEFEGVYSKKEYKKSQNYLKTNTSFELITSAFSISITLLFWFLKGFAILDCYVREFNYGPVTTGIIYIGILILSKTILSFPFSIYKTFVIEKKFGFNKTTVKIFLTDILKGGVLAILIGIPLVGGLLAFFQYTGSNAWIYCFTALIAFALLMQIIIPSFIMPLFNKFLPLEDKELKDAIFAYADSIDFPLVNIFIMDGSKRSSKSNAFFTGIGKHKKIVLYDTLIEKHTIPELVAILAHEMGHYKKKHIIKTFAILSVQTGITFFILSICLTYQPLFDAFYVKEMSVYAGMIFFSLLFSPIDFITNIFMNILSRKHEFQADKFAAKTTRNSTALISALKKLSVNNLSNLCPHDFYAFLNYSHPPVLKRIEVLSSFVHDTK